MDDQPVTTSELAAGPSSSESGGREKKDLKEKGAEGGEEEPFRKLCSHYSRGCSFVVSEFGSTKFSQKLWSVVKHTTSEERVIEALYRINLSLQWTPRGCVSRVTVTKLGSVAFTFIWIPVITQSPEIHIFYYSQE